MLFSAGLGIAVALDTLARQQISGVAAAALTVGFLAAWCWMPAMSGVLIVVATTACASMTVSGAGPLGAVTALWHWLPAAAAMVIPAAAERQVGAA